MAEPVAESEDLKTPIRVEAREGFRIWVEFDDGVSGEADISDFASQPGFACWRDRSRFERVQINAYDYLDWGIDEDRWESVIDPDEIYSRITGLSMEEIYPEWATQQRDRPSPTEVTAVEPRDGFTLWLEFADGTSGIADLSFLADSPAFTGWQDRSYFESVRVVPGGDVQWGDDLRRCGYSLYIDLTGLPWEEVWARLREKIIVV